MEENPTNTPTTPAEMSQETVPGPREGIQNHLKTLLCKMREIEYLGHIQSFWVQHIAPRKRLVLGLGVFTFLVVGLAFFLSHERAPKAQAHIRMTKTFKQKKVLPVKPVQHTKPVTPLVGESNVMPASSQDAINAAMPADSAAFIGAQIEVTPSGYLPKISEKGVTNYQAHARPVSPKALAAPYKLSIIVGGLGLDSTYSTMVMNELPKDIALAFYSYVGQSHDLNVQARTQGFETFVMLPLEPMTFPKDDPGPDALLTGLEPSENIQRLYKHLSQMTGFVGTLAYQGSRFMRSSNDFSPILEEHAKRGLIFLDPTVSRRTLTHDLGKKLKAPVLKTVLTMSPDLSDTQIDRLLEKTIEALKENGSAIMYVEFSPVTLEALKKFLSQLENQKIALVPVTSQKLNVKHGY